MTTGDDILITGLGLVSAQGLGFDALGSGVGPTEVTSFDTSTMPVRVAYQVSKVKPQPYMLRRKDLKLMSRDARLAVLAAGLAVEDAGISPMEPESWPMNREEIGLFMGVGLEPGNLTELSLVAADCKREDNSLDLDRLGRESIDLIPPLSALKTLPNMALAHVSINFGLMGPGEALSPWGTSGFAALQAAVESMRRGECEMALVGAADSDVDLGGLTSHARLGYLAPLTDASERDGQSLRGDILGEGAVFFVLETRRCAEARGAKAWASVRGVTLGAATGEGVARFDVDGLEPVLRPWAAKASTIVSAAGHHEEHRKAEATAIEAMCPDAELAYSVEEVGSCVAASGLLELGVALAQPNASRGDLVGLARGLSGGWASACLSREEATR